MPLPEPKSPERRLFEIFAPSVAYVAVINSSGEHEIGTCFHIGDNVFITARHVVERKQITKIATTVATIDSSFGMFNPGAATKITGPFFHTNDKYDIAALKLTGISSTQIPFKFVERGQRNEDFVMRSVVVMGYPPIPGSKSPILLCARAEVNAVFNTYFDDQQVMVVSCLGRGGFSGGPALTPQHHCLGVVTRAMLNDSKPEELGFMAVVGAWPILEMLDHHQIMPGYLRSEIWGNAANRRR